MTIMAHDFSSNDFRDYDDNNFIPLQYATLSAYTFTIDSLPEGLKNSTSLICKISDDNKDFCGTYLFDKHISSDSGYTFKKKDQNEFCLLNITNKDNINAFPPFGIGKRPSSPIWIVRLTPPLVYDDKEMGGIVTIKTLDSTNQTNNYEYQTRDDDHYTVFYRMLDR